MAQSTTNRKASIASRAPLYLTAVVFTVVMLLLFAKDGLQYAVISIVAGVFFGFVLDHFEVDYERWRKETGAAGNV